MTTAEKAPHTIVAIDGPAGAGKSTIAAMLARRLDIPYLDTGAMYRAVALLALREGIRDPLDSADERRIEDLVGADRIQVESTQGGTRVLLDGVDVGGEIRSPECAHMASVVSAVPLVRRAMVAMQRRLGLAGGGVMEGRDIGSVVFPDAALKVFLTASSDERARRRHHDLKGAEAELSFEEVRRQQQERDHRDSSRADSPLMVAPGAIVVDTTGLSPSEVVERLLEELTRSCDMALDSTGRNTVRSRNHRS